MALARIINEAKFKTLSADIQAEYSKSGDDYELDATGYPDGEADAALRKAKDNAAAEARDAKKLLAEANAKLADNALDKTKASGTVADVDAAWQKKFDTQAEEHTAALSTKDTYISTSLVDNVAAQLAGELTNSPANAKIMLPHIKSRLSADLTGVVPSTKVIGANGKVSTATIDDLRKEFVDNKDFGSIVTGTKASGGGAPTTSTGGGAPNSQQKHGEPVDLSKLDSKGLAETIAAKKAEQT